MTLLFMPGPPLGICRRPRTNHSGLETEAPLGACPEDERAKQLEFPLEPPLALEGRDYGSEARRCVIRRAMSASEHHSSSRDRRFKRGRCQHGFSSGPARGHHNLSTRNSICKIWAFKGLQCKAGRINPLPRDASGTADEQTLCVAIGKSRVFARP